MRRATRPCGRRWRNISEYRGVQCGPHQIVVGAGLEYLLGLLAPLLPGPAAVETPGYPVLCRCCRTTVCTAAAYRWTRTAFRWKH